MQNTMLDSTVSVSDQELSDASSAIKLFENPQFRVRVIMRLGDPWFVAKDACDCLGVSNSRDAVARLDDEKDVGKADTLGGSWNRAAVPIHSCFALLCTLLGVKSDNTISNHIEALLKRGVIEVVKNLTTLKIPTNSAELSTMSKI